MNNYKGPCRRVITTDFWAAKPFNCVYFSFQPHVFKKNQIFISWKVWPFFKKVGSNPELLQLKDDREVNHWTQVQLVGEGLGK